MSRSKWLWSVSRFSAALAFFFSMMMFSPSPPATAAGPQPNFLLPLGCGITARVSTYSGHTRHAADLNVGSGSDDLGLPVLAAAAGRVSRIYASNGEVDIDHGNGWVTRYAHMSPIRVSVGDYVGQGFTIGNVSNKGVKAVHLHLSIRRDGSTYPGTVQGQVLVRGWTVATRYITSSNCGQQSSTNNSTGRLAFSRDDGALFRTCSTCPWHYMAGPGASMVAVDGQRMGMYVPWDGLIFRANDSSPWTVITGAASKPTSLGVSDSGRMAFSRDDGAWFRVNDNSPWQHMAGPGASMVAVDDNAMAMFVPWDGLIFRKNDNSPWTVITGAASNPTSVAISDNGRLAFSRDDGAWFRTCWDCPWQQMAGPGAKMVAVDDNAMAMFVPWDGLIFRYNDASPWTVMTGAASNPTSVAIHG